MFFTQNVDFGFFDSYKSFLLGKFKKRRIWDSEENREGTYVAEWKWNFSVNFGERKPGKINLPTAVLGPGRELRVMDSLAIRSSQSPRPVSEVDATKFQPKIEKTKFNICIRIQM